MLLSAVLLSPDMSIPTSAAENIEGTKDYEIINPYESVNWSAFGKYKACLHMHTDENGGLQSPKEMIEDCYKKGYDIAAITDHDITNTTWDRNDRNTDKYLTTERLNEIKDGTDRNGRGMIGIPLTTEQSVFDHVNTFWANFVNGSDATIESKIAKCEELGGISHINHPGDASSSLCFDGDQITEMGRGFVDKYTKIFLKYPSCVGIEAFNAGYGNRESFRLIWDHILMNTMPKRMVWGFSSDDTHYTTGTGFNFNIMLMPENTEENIRYSMENGTFYAVAALTNTADSQDSFPVIDNIVVNQDKNLITITGENYDVIEWVADSKIIATGNSIDLNNFEDKVNNYIRAQLKGPGGMSLTQPFGIIEKSTAKIGDIDGIGEVNAIDYALLKRHLLGLGKLSVQQIQFADVDGNGFLNAIDFAFMRQYLLGMIKVFPAEQAIR